MVLAQITEATKIAGKALDQSAEFGFGAYISIVLIIGFVVMMGVHFWYIIRPEANNRIECSRKLADAVQAFAVNDAAKVQILDQIADWHRAHDSRLSAIKCPMQQVQPSVQTANALPHGA